MKGTQKRKKHSYGDGYAIHVLKVIFSIDDKSHASKQ